MLGARIASLRRSAGWSQMELARRLQISASAVGMYEQGRREPAAELLVAMAALFGVSVDYLLTGKPESDKERQTAQQTMLHAVAEMDKRLNCRENRPFSRQEMMVLFAALLMES